jgi:hypothetical protein
VVEPEFEPTRRNNNATVGPPIVAPTARNSEACPITPAPVGPGISASITPAVTPRAPTVTPTAFMPVAEKDSDSVYFFLRGHLLVRGLRQHLPYFRNPLADAAIIAGPGIHRVCFRALRKQTSTGRKL